MFGRAGQCTKVERMAGVVEESSMGAKCEQLYSCSRAAPRR